MRYIVQYSVCGKNPAISEWREYSTKIDADNLKDATAKFNRTHQRLGTWMVIDCYPDQ